MNHNPEIIELVNKSPILNPGDKDFIISKLDDLSPLEKLKLQTNLASNIAPEILQTINEIRASFFKQETPPAPDFLTKMAQKISPTKPKPIISHTILNNPAYLGGQLPRPYNAPPVRLQSLAQITKLSELNSLSPFHITFNLNENSEQKLNDFYLKLDQLFSEVLDIHIRRSYFMMFLQSPLYLGYIETGLTALRHPEITPANIVLNRLQQIHPKFLNTRQFQTASKICAHIRMLCGI